MIDILFVRPADDSSAGQIATWGQAVRQMAGSFQSDDLYGTQATRSAVDQKLSSGCQHLCWFGHGTEATLIANGKPIVDASNLGTLRDGILIAFACYAAVMLGIRGTPIGL